MSISINEFLKLNKKNNIIDIRSVEKYNFNHLPYATHIPYEKLIIDLNKYLKKNEFYYIYCQQGIATKKVCSMLSKQGFKLVNIIGGYEAYILEGNI